MSAVLWLAAGPQAVRGQWIVNDPANLAQAVQNGVQMYNQLKTARRQYQRIKRNLKKLRDPNFRDIAGIQRAVDDALSSANGLAYSAGQLDQRFRAMFPGQLPDNFDAARQDRMQKMLGTMQGTLRSLRDQANQLRDSYQDIQSFKSQVQNIQTPQQARELGSTIQAYQAEEMMMLRKSVMAMTNQQAAMNAYEVNRHKQQVQRAKRLISSLDRLENIDTKSFDGEWNFLDN